MKSTMQYLVVLRLKPDASKDELRALGSRLLTRDRYTFWSHFLLRSRGRSGIM
jgi:hypothetical protein